MTIMKMIPLMTNRPQGLTANSRPGNVSAFIFAGLPCPSAPSFPEPEPDPAPALTSTRPVADGLAGGGGEERKGLE